MLSTLVSHAKMAELTNMLFEGRHTWAKGTLHWISLRVQIPWDGALFEGDMLSHCNIPLNECIAHCSPAQWHAYDG